MTAPSRIFLDVSYTRTQTGNVGITRTVRRIWAALQQQHPCCIPVAYNHSGFRHVSRTTPSVLGGDTHPSASLYRRLTSGASRRIASACLPLPLLHTLWSAANRWTFDRLSATEQPVAFEAGDWLVLADESWNYRAWRSAALARARGAKVILVLYDLIPVQHPEFCAPLFARIFPGWLLRMLTACDAVMCISRDTMEDLRAFCRQVDLPCPPAAHFRLGCDLPHTGGGHVRTAVSDFLGVQIPCFAAIGTIEPRKNYELLLAVFDRMWRTGLDAHLFIGGRVHPDSRRLLEQMQQHPQHGHRLLVLLNASDAEIDLAYTTCRALLFPSLAEGFGLPLVEARARGCLVIASALPALLEMADEGVFFFPPNSADALEALIREHARTSRPGAIPPAKLFTWQDSATQLVAEAGRLLTLADSRCSPAAMSRAGDGLA
jgi:alpha-1,2-rhamnosyltransferase